MRWIRKHPVLSIVIAGFLLRLAFFFHWQGPPAAPPLHSAPGADVLGLAALRPPGAVQDDYFERAVKLLHGEPLTLAQDLFRPPLYAWALYLLFLVSGPKIAVAQVLQCALGAGTAWLLYRMGRTLGDEKAGVAAAGVWAVNVYSVFYSARLMNETLYVALTVAFFWAWLEAAAKAPPPPSPSIPLPLAGEGGRRPGEGGASHSSVLFGCIAGLLAGLSCLCKWTFMGFLPWFAVSEGWPVLRQLAPHRPPAPPPSPPPPGGRKEIDYPPPLWGRVREGVGRSRALLVCLAVAALVIGLWGLRNLHRHGRFILAGPQKGWNFYEGLALQTAEDPERPRLMAEEAARLGLDQQPFKQDDYFWKKGWDEVREDPVAAFWLFAGKAVKFWRLAPYPPHPRLLRWGAGLFYLVLFTCAISGALMAHRRGIRLAPFYALFLYTWLLHTVFFSGIRYRFPLDPFLSLLAGFSLAELLWGSGKEAT